MMGFVPVSAAGHLIGLIRGFRDLRDLGLILRGDALPEPYRG